MSDIVFQQEALTKKCLQETVKCQELLETNNQEARELKELFGPQFIE